ncbi:DoxX family protein [uncultured Hymenobacter sp.]|uniref:DoxX family protein n=1 Tax=uncultured Hymenobacter sp. TaxID=170016 RepID=UPI0035CB870B
METPRPRPVWFWVVTSLLAFGMLAGGTAQLLRAPFNVEGMRHLGYPLYVLSIVGAWKLAGVLVILLPGWRLAKEWAYAGFFFLLISATISHLASGDGLGGALPSFLFVCLTVASWQLRPASRRLVPALALSTQR